MPAFINAPQTCSTDGPRGVGRPVEQAQHRDGVLGRRSGGHARLRRPETVARLRFEVAGTQVGGVERGMVVGQRGVAFGEPFGVVERRDVRAAGLVHRAEQALGAFLVDAGDPHGVGDDRPRIVGLAGRAVLHRVERRRRPPPRCRACACAPGRGTCRRRTPSGRGPPGREPRHPRRPRASRLSRARRPSPVVKSSAPRPSARCWCWLVVVMVSAPPGRQVRTRSHERVLLPMPSRP